MGKLYILRLPISYSVYVPKIMKIGRQWTKLSPKISGLLFFGPPCAAIMECFFELTRTRSEPLLVCAICRSPWLHNPLLLCGTAMATSSVQPLCHPRCVSRMCQAGSLVCHTALEQYTQCHASASYRYEKS